MMTTLSTLKGKIKNYLKPLKNLFSNKKQETDALYRLFYHYVHDKDRSISLASLQTKNAFAFQWENFREGDGLLADPWFGENVSRILCEEELQINSQWFKGKEVLDAGCGNGRWSYGFAQLGCNVTAVDINQVALDETEEALEKFSIHKEFVRSPLEQLTKNLGHKQFDLVFSWGVVHHCESFKPNLPPTSYPQLKRTIEMERTMTQSRVYPLTSRRSFQIDCCFMLRIERI